MGKVRDAVPLAWSGMFPPVGEPPDCQLTLCSALKVHVTEPPAAIVTQLGEKVSPTVATDAVVGAPPPVTAMAVALEATVDVAVTLVVPTPIPVATTVAPVAGSARTNALVCDQVTGRVKGCCCASRGVAVNDTVPQIAVVVALGKTVTLATGTGGCVPPSPPPPPPHPAMTAAAPTKRTTRIS